MPKKTPVPDPDEPNVYGVVSDDETPEAITPDEPLTEETLEGFQTPEPEKKPKPGDADYDWSTHYDTDDLYIHTFPDGKVLAIKAFGKIYSKTFLYKIRYLATEADVEFAALDRASCDVAREVLANLDDTVGDPIEDLYQAWLAAGTAQAEGGEGLTPGN